jgi:predicted Zn-dependent peptidase
MLTGSRMALAASGALDGTAVARRVARSFAQLSVGNKAERERLPTPRDTEGRLVTADRATAQALLKLGYATFEGFPDDHAAFELMNYILCGAGQGSWLYQLLRTELGVTAAVRCSANPRLNGPATYEVRFSGKPITMAKALAAACVEMRTMKEEGLTAAELERAKSAYLEGHVPSMYRTPQRVALRLGERALLGRYDFVRSSYLGYYAGDQEQMDAVRRVTLDEVNAAARKYIRPDAAIITVVGPLDAVRQGGELRHCRDVLSVATR